MAVTLKIPQSFSPCYLNTHLKTEQDLRDKIRIGTQLKYYNGTFSKLYLWTIVQGEKTDTRLSRSLVVSA